MRNSPPTVVITQGPPDIVVIDSVKFCWVGADADGNLAGYCYGLDDSTPETWTEQSELLLRGTSFGPHAFYVQAVDDSGARSSAAVRSFRVEYDSSIVPRGTDTTFEVATWNVENFPLSGEATVSKLRAVIARLDIDLYGIQEIADTAAFLRLVSGLQGYEGFYSSDDYGGFYQKTGVVYKSEVVSVSNVRQLFWGDWAFPRPPLEIQVTASHNGASFDFKLIVLHLKAGSSGEERAMRDSACRALKYYLDRELAQGQEQDFLVIGDWNDRLEDEPEENVFAPFLEDSLDYRFLTWELRGSSSHASHIGSGALIDHLMATSDLLNEYEQGTTTTLRLDDELTGYEGLISDHRPVVAYFPVFRK